MATSGTVSGRRRDGSIGASLLLGGIAGIAGTAAMTVAMQALHRHLPEPDRYPLPPREIAERTMVAGSSPSGLDLSTLTIAAHFGYGALSGSMFALGEFRAEPIRGGLYGVAVWAASYLGWIPAAGILTPAHRHPARRNGLMLAAHLVWGGCMALVLQSLIGARNDVFGPGALLDGPGRARGASSHDRSVS